MNTIQRNNNNINFKANLTVKIGEEFLANPINVEKYAYLQEVVNFKKGIDFVKEMAPIIGKPTDNLLLESGDIFHNVVLTFNNEHYAYIGYPHFDSFIEGVNKIQADIAASVAKKHSPGQIKYDENPADYVDAIKKLNTIG